MALHLQLVKYTASGAKGTLDPADMDSARRMTYRPPGQ